MKKLFTNKASQADEACKRGDFEKAISMYTDCIGNDSMNPVLYSNRSAALVKNKNYEAALQDGFKATQLQPTWPKAHYRQGVALQHMNRHSEALAAFATAVAHDSSSEQLLQTLIEAGLKSPLQATLSPVFEQLQAMGMDNNPFIIASIIGQELLSVREVYPAITVLEAALQIGTTDVKLKESVLSALSSAHWKTGNTKRAMRYMEDDLKTAEELNNDPGQCRAHGNLGNAYYSQNMYKKSLKHHKLQLNIATRTQDRKLIAEALTSLGHVYVSTGDHTSALASHKRCLLIRKELGDRAAECRELGNVGSVYNLMSDYRNASQYHLESLRIAEEICAKSEMIKACNNLGSLYHNMRQLQDSVTYFMQALEIAGQQGNLPAQCRALGGLGHTYRSQAKLDDALKCHEKQLKLAIKIKDRSSEARARSNLGVVLQQKGQFRHALDFHKSHLVICRELSDKDGEGRACGNIGNAYHSLSQFERAVKYHKYAIALSKELRDQHSEASLHGNLAVAFQALEMFDEAESHYKKHLEMTQGLSDLNGECRAESNLGNFYIAKGDAEAASNHYANQLTIAEQLDNCVEMAKACHSLAYAFYLRGSYHDAINYYERNIRLASELGERSTLSTVYCNLGLAYLAVNNFEKAAASQKKFLLAASEKKNVFNICKALGNIGEVYFKEENYSEALRYFSEYLKITEDNKLETQKAVACNKLARTYLNVGNYKKALEMFNRELALNKAFNNTSRMFDCYESIAHIHLSKKNLNEAHSTYMEQLELATGLKDVQKQAKALNKLGLCLIQLGSCKEALHEFEKQLEILGNSELEKGRCHGHIAECYFLLKKFPEALKHYEICLERVSAAGSMIDQDRAYGCLCTVHKAMNNMEEARVCTEKRLVLSHDSEDAARCEAYGELGEIHLCLGNYDQALSYFESQQKAAKESKNTKAEIVAMGGLGRVHEKKGTFEKALKFHILEYEAAERSADIEAEGKAASSLGLIYKHLGKFTEAIKYSEKALSVGNKLKDEELQRLAYSRLALVKHLICRSSESVNHLQKALDIAARLKNTTEIIKCCFRLGMCDFVQGKNKSAERYFEKAIQAYDGRNTDHGKGHEEIQFVMSAFQMLQRSLVAEKKYFDALKIAEKSRLFECQIAFNAKNSDDKRLSNYRNSLEAVLKKLNKIDSIVLYYSIAGGQILIWLLSPGKGIVKFTMVPLLDGYCDSDFEGADLDDIPQHSLRSVTDILDRFIKELRKSIGVAAHCSKTELRRTRSFDTEMVEILPPDQMPLKKYSRIGRRATAFSPSARVTKSTYNFAMKEKPPGAVKAIDDSDWMQKAQLSPLHDLLIRPVRNELNVLRSKHSDPVNIMIIIPNDLLLVPFSLLKDSPDTKFLAEKYRIRTASSLCLAAKAGLTRKGKPTEEPFRDLIVNGNEAALKEEISSMKRLLGADVIVVSDGEKDALKSKLSSANIIHFATRIAWSGSSLILSDEDVGRLLTGSPNSEPDIEALDSPSRMSCPSMPDVFLSAEEVSNLDLHAKLVIFAVSQIIQHDDTVASDKLNTMIDAFLLAGADAVLVSHWPIPSAASKHFFTTFFQKFNDGADACAAFQQSVIAVKQSADFSHPSNWGGFMLCGKDVSLHKKRASLAQVLHLLLERPNRDTIKVLLHLVEKARQRIAQGKRSSMYTTTASVRGKVGDVLGWQELLTMVGFRFERATNDLPDSVFFPWTDHVGILNRCSNTLYAFLGLTRNGMEAMSKLRSAPEVSQSLIRLLREVIECFADDSSNVQVPLSIKIWRVPGCHELLSSLGFDLMGVGRDEVVLRSGRSSLRRPLQCALQAIIDLFEADDTEGDFMCNVNGRAFSEVQLRDQQSIPGVRSLSHDSIDSGFHPVRKARSSPIKHTNKNGFERNRDPVERSNNINDGNNNNHSLLSLNTKVGLFGGKGSEADIGPSARRLRVRGSNTNVSRGVDENDYRPKSSNPNLSRKIEDRSYRTLQNFGALKPSSSLKKFSTSESLLDLNMSQTDGGKSDKIFFLPDDDNDDIYPKQTGQKTWINESDEQMFRNSRKSQTLPAMGRKTPSTNSIPIRGSNAAPRNGGSLPRSGVLLPGSGNSLARSSNSGNSLYSVPQTELFPLSDLSEEEMPNRAWIFSEDSDTSLSSSASGASKGSVKFRFDGKIENPVERSKSKKHGNDGKDFYSKANQSLVIRNKLAGRHSNDSTASITRGTTIIDALRLEKRDSSSSFEAVLPDNNASASRPYYHAHGSFSSTSTDSNVIENLRNYPDSPASPPSSLPSSISSVHSSEDAARNVRENFANFASKTRKRVSSANGSLVISRI